MNDNMKKVALNYGLLTGSVGVLYFLASYIIDESLFVNPIGSVSVIIITLVLPFFSIRAYKKLNNGFATFQEAFSAYILPVILSIFIGFIFNLFMYNVVDSDLATRQGEMAFESMMEMPEQRLQATIGFMGIDSINELEEKIIKDARENVTLVGQLKISAMGFVFFALIGLIAGAVGKKNPPEFD